MNRWDIVLLVVGAVVAVRILVRLMLARRDLLIAQVKTQLKQQRRQVKAKQDKQDAA